MNPLLELAPYAAMADRIAERLSAGRDRSQPLASWTEEVIVASSGLAAAIGSRVLDRLPAGVAGLRLQSIETLATRIVNAAGHYPRVASERERRLAMRSASRSVDEPLMETRGAAAMLERTYRDVRDSGVTVAELATRINGTSSLRNRGRIRSMIRAWQEYERLIGRLEAIDPSDLLARAVAALRSGAPVPVQILAGFYDMTGAQMALIATLREVEKLAAVYVPVERGRPAPFAQKFITWSGGELLPDPLLHIRSAKWTVSEYRTREAEIENVCAAVESSIAAGSNRIAVVARTLDPYDVQLFQRFSQQRGFSVSMLPATPLIAQRFGRGLSLLLRLRERGFLRSDVIEIVRCGLRVSTRINIDKADAETRRAQIAAGTSAELSRRSSKFAVADYVSLVAELETLTEKIDIRFLRRIPDLFRIETGADLAAIEAIDAIVDVFLRATAWNKPFDVSDVLDAIDRSQLDAGKSSAAPQVWLGDVMRFRGHSFDEVFAIRMQDDVLPQRRIEDPLLPDAERRALGVREIGNGRDEEHLLFQLLGDGASEAIHFSLAASDGLGKLLRPSQYLKNFVIEQRPEAKQQLLKNFSRWVSGGQAILSVRTAKMACPPLRPLQLLSRAGSRGSFDGYITSERVLARTAAALQAVSPTQLEDFGECPQKFLFKHILRVRDIEDPEREVQINHRDKGTLDHRILERFYRALTEADIAAASIELPRLPVALAERLDEIVEEEFDELESRVPAYNRQMRTIERKATKRVLRDFISDDLADMVSRGMTPKHFEYRFGSKYKDVIPDRAEPFLVEARGVLLRVEGMIDRIDTDGSSYRIIDYKSGKAGRHQNLSDKVDRGVRLQLAVYAMAVADFFGSANVSAAIKPLVRSDVDIEKFAFGLSDKRDRLRETLEMFVSAILRGAFPAFPNESDTDFNSCKYCPVNHSCRTKHDPAERRAALRFDDPRSLLESL